MQLYLKPYKNENNNQAEFLAIVSGVVTILSGLVFTEDEQNNALNNVILIAAIILNIMFCIKWTSLILKIYEKKSKFIKTVILKF